MNFNREWCWVFVALFFRHTLSAFTRFPVPCQRLLISSHDVAVLFPLFGFCKDFIHVCPGRRYAILPSKPRDLILSELHSYRIDLLSLFLSTLHSNPENYQLFIKLKPPLHQSPSIMPDLRRQIFESGKTTSRKAASREASRATSRASSKQTSRQSSRAASRQPSDDEDAGYLSDETAMR